MTPSDTVGPLFFSIPPMRAWKLDAPDYLKGATIRITDIQPTGYINAYCVPKTWIVTRFDAERPEHRLETAEPLVWLQKMDGAETFKAELVAFEHDADAERRAMDDSPKPINFGGPGRTLLDRLE